MDATDTTIKIDIEKDIPNMFTKQQLWDALVLECNRNAELVGALRELITTDKLLGKDQKHELSRSITQIAVKVLNNQGGE